MKVVRDDGVLTFVGGQDETVTPGSFGAYGVMISIVLQGALSRLETITDVNGFNGRQTFQMESSELLTGIPCWILQPCFGTSFRMRNVGSQICSFRRVWFDAPPATIQGQWCAQAVRTNLAAGAGPIDLPARQMGLATTLSVLAHSDTTAVIDLRIGNDTEQEFAFPGAITLAAGASGTFAIPNPLNRFLLALTNTDGGNPTDIETVVMLRVGLPGS